MAAGIRITYHIRRWRLRRHLDQAALGAQVGVGASTISAYEHGAVDIPTSRLCRLAQALRVTLNDLVTWTEAPAPPKDRSSASTDGLRDPSRPGPQSLS